MVTCLHFLEWEGLQPRVIAYLKKYQQDQGPVFYERLIYSRCKILSRFWSQRRKSWNDGAVPDHHYVAHLPQVRVLMNIPAGEEFTVSTLDALRPHVEEIVSTWLARGTLALINAINAVTTVQLPLDANLSRLTLGTFFIPSARSRYGETLRTYPGILTDPRCQLCPDPGHASDSRGHAEYLAALVERKDGDWTFESWVFTLAQNLIELCGLDPLQASPEDMDNVGVRLECACEDCESEDHKEPGETQALYTWRSAVSNVCVSHMFR